MKKRMITLLTGAMLIAAVGSANALMLTLQEGALTTTVFSSNGVVNFNGSFGDYMINVVTGLSVASTPTNPVMDLNTVNVNAVSNPASSLHIYLTQNSFNGAVPAFLATIGGTTAGQITYNTYLDTANNATFLNAFKNPFATEILLTSLAFNATPFSGSATADMPSVNGLYSLTQELEITQTGPYAISSMDATLAPVPEPETMLLLGFGMLCLAVYGKRRMNKEA